MAKPKMRNAVARKHYLHCQDQDDTGARSYYFSQRPWDDEGWGFWVSPAGAVTTDETSANGSMPSARVVAACVRAAVAAERQKSRA